MDVYWLEQTEAEVPPADDWLSENEAARLNGLRFGKRRADWRLGRWTAKRAVAAFLRLPSFPKALRGIEIVPASSGAPEVFLGRQPAPVKISISHRAGTAACAVIRPEGLLGCDLEIVEARSEAFVTDYFTPEEQTLIAASDRERSRLLALLWSSKESALKALGTGLRDDPRSMVVTLDGWRVHDAARHVDAASLESANAFDAWRPLSVRDARRQFLRGWWRASGNLLRTMTAAPSPAPPVFLETPN